MASISSGYTRIIDWFRGGRPKDAQPGEGKATARTVIANAVRPEARDTPELVNRMRRDEQVTFAEHTLRACIKRIDVFVTTESTDPRALTLAEKLQSLWHDSLDDFLESIAFGRVAFERTVMYDPGINLSYTECLESLPFHMSEMVLACGRFNGVIVKDKQRDSQQVTLTKSESLWMAIDAEPLNPHGRSRFLGAPYEVWQKRQLVTGNDGLEEKFLKRFVLRGGKAHVEAVVVDERTGQTIDNIAATEAVYQATLSGGCTIFSNARFPQDQGGGYKNDFTESPSTLDPTPMTNVIDKIDIRMLRAFGIPEKTVIDNGAGSWDLVSLQMLILWAVTEGLLQQFVDVFQADEIDPCVEYNFGPGSGIEIKATFTRPSQQPDSILSEVAKSLMTSGQLSPVVLSGGVDVRKILETVGIPVTADLESRLQLILSALADAAGQPPVQPGGGFGGDPNAPPGLPSNGPAAMANAAGSPTLADQFADQTIPLQQGFPDSIPDQFHVQMEAVGSLDQLFDELVKAAARRDDQTVKRIIDEINSLHAQSRVAAAVIGRLTPIRPSLQKSPAGAKVGRRVPLKTMQAAGRSKAAKALANVATAAPADDAGPGAGRGKSGITISPLADSDGEPGERPYYTFLEDGAKYLREKKVATDEELRNVSASVRRSMFTVPGVNEVPLLEAIRNATAESTRLGETHEQFEERLTGVVSLPASQSRTLLRTEMKSAFVDGLDKTIQKPNVKAYFPYVRFVTTKDGRTRPSHAALGKANGGAGFVCSTDDAAYDTLRAALSDYNCRCALIPLTEKQAESYGINTSKNLPKIVRAEYGSG